MNILFLLGNGFDLNIGLRTSYKDFYTYYKKESSKSDKIKQLKEDILDDFENWSDLELSFGKYTNKINTLKEFDEIFEDIVEKLSDYLSGEEKQINVASLKINKENLFNNLIYPERTLIEVNRNILENYKNKWNNSQWNVNIITFNYTKSLEKLLDYKDSRMNLQANKYLQGITHIHGFIDNKMVMGVNDTSQISNKIF